MTERRKPQTIGEDLIALRGEFRVAIIDLRKDYDFASKAIINRLDLMNGNVADTRRDVDEHIITHIKDKAATDIEKAHDSGEREGRSEVEKKHLAILGGTMTAAFSAITVLAKVFL